MSDDHLLDKKTQKFIISELNRWEKYEIKDDLQPRVIDWKAVVQRSIGRVPLLCASECFHDEIGIFRYYVLQRIHNS